MGPRVEWRLVNHVVFLIHQHVIYKVLGRVKHFWVGSWIWWIQLGRSSSNKVFHGQLWRGHIQDFRRRKHFMSGHWYFTKGAPSQVSLFFSMANLAIAILSGQGGAMDESSLNTPLNSGHFPCVMRNLSWGNICSSVSENDGTALSSLSRHVRLSI